MSDLLDETIANVASGSISDATQKIIAKKQLNMILHSEEQEKNYLERKRQREIELDTKAFVKLDKKRKIERIKRLRTQHTQAGTMKKGAQIIVAPPSPPSPPAVIKKKRHRRTKLELLMIAQQQEELERHQSKDDAAATTSKTKTKMSTIKKTQKDLNKRQLKLTKQEKQLAARPPPPQLIAQSNGLDTSSYEDLNDEDVAVPDEDEMEDSAATETKTQLSSEEKRLLKLVERKCFICKQAIHQDKINEHCSKHYYESAKCARCDKVSTNPSNFVTHALSHLRKFLIIYFEISTEADN